MKYFDGNLCAMPRVTVAVCAYNQERYVEATLTSAFNQSYKNIEFVIVDDLSTDGTAERIRGLLKANERNAKFIVRERNGGQMAAMLEALDASSAPFIVWVDGDDVLQPNFVETHIRYHLNAVAACAFTCSNMAVIDAKDQIIAGAIPALSDNGILRMKQGLTEILPLSDAGDQAECGYFIEKNYRSWAWSATSGMMFRRAVIELIRPERADTIRISADNYFARFAHVVGASLIIPAVLGFYRMHGGNNFSRFQIVGDRAGGTLNSRAQIDAMNEEFAKVLQKRPEIITSCLDKAGLYGFVRRISTSRKVTALLLGNREISKELTYRRRLSMLLRSVRLAP